MPLRLFVHRPIAAGLLLSVALGTGCSLASGVRPEPSVIGSDVTPTTSCPDPVLSAPLPPAPSAVVVPIEPGDLPGDLRAEDEASNEPLALQAPMLAEPMLDFPIEINGPVKAALNQLQTRRWVGIARAFARARRYAGMMRAIFREQSLPEELVNLAFVESHVNPHATSHLNAAGMWQFVPSTARIYGMRTSRWIDERRDPEKSTRAAAAYLKSLFERFKSWPLALAAYNAGEATVQRAIERQHTSEFWRLKLPKETRRFVPSFFAMTIISRDPQRYGFSRPAEEPYETEDLHIGEATEIQRIAEATGTSVKHIRELNPELIGPGTPPNHPGYALRIPRRVRWVSHTVRKGDTLARIAKRYGVSVDILREMNNITNPETLRQGAVILVPTAVPPPPA